ncbi:MAG: YmdB family metallophosphoesterase [Clostridia bacterium]|nr:YmdB family metallophosphoesterase [Clostridia bacterium]
MILNLLAVGDVVGEQGLAFLEKHLRAVQRLHGVHFTVVNGENASGVGILPRQARQIYDAGADVVTLGNHTWNRIQIKDLVDDAPWLLRPANYTSRVPGRGLGVYEGPRGLRIAVMNLIGRCEMDSNFENPFTTADKLLASCEADLAVVDFHAEATSEKGALGWYLDGRVQALWGTHTHVPTADAKVLPKGTGFLTDLGMTGPDQSVLGMQAQQAVNRFLGGLPIRFEPADGPCRMDAAVFSIDTATKRCVEVKRVDVGE